MTAKRKELLLITCLAISLSVMLWLTLFSRIGADSRHFYPPFWSYKAILNGSGKALLEDIGNVVLFVPVGVAIALLLGLSVKHSLLIGFTFSLIIESCQWFFWLGSFEIDDLIHNSIGAGLGALLVTRTAFGAKLKPGNRKKSAAALMLLTILIILSGFAYQGLKWQEMRRLAALNDREDGKSNLLILNPDPVYIGETDFSVAYQSDGSILIEGSSDKKAWIDIGKVTLEVGDYSFSSQVGQNETSVTFNLQYFDTEKEKYVRLTPDVGFEESATFELDTPTKIRTLVGIKEGAEGAYTARPVIYRED